MISLHQSKRDTKKKEPNAFQVNNNTAKSSSPPPLQLRSTQVAQNEAILEESRNSAEEATPLNGVWSLKETTAQAAHPFQFSRRYEHPSDFHNISGTDFQKGLAAHSSFIPANHSDGKQGLSVPLLQRSFQEETINSPQARSAKGFYSKANSEAVVQRFRKLDTSGYQLQPDTSPNARAPFTRFDDEMSVTNRGPNQAMGIEWKKHLDALPNLNVANDNTLAINAADGENKEFYATDAALQDATTKLDHVNSPVELNKSGNTITIPGTGAAKSLTMIQPGVKGKAAPGSDEFVSLAANICRDTAKDIMGKSISHILLKNQNEKTRVKIDTADPTIIQGPHSLAESLTQQDLTTDEAAKVISDEKKSAEPKVGEDYGKASRPGGAFDTRAHDLGINEHAWSSVGQGYVTQTISNLDASKSKVDYSKTDEPENQFVWGYHFSAVVAESEDHDDQIAMENYARKGDIVEAKQKLLTALKSTFKDEMTKKVLLIFKKADLKLQGDQETQIGQIIEYIDNKVKATAVNAKAAYNNMFRQLNGDLNSHWYFRMVGKGKGQSFHEQMAASGFFANPMTLSVANAVGSTEVIAFNPDSSEMKGISKNNTKSCGERLLSSIHQGLVKNPVHIVGYGKNTDGSPNSTLGDQRSQAVKTELEQIGIPANMLIVDASPGKNDAPNATQHDLVILKVGN